MWNVLRHQIRSYVEAKKKQKDAAVARPTLHMKRTGAEILVQRNAMEQGVVVKARVVLNDLTAAGVHTFSAQQIVVGSSVALTMEEPKRFYVRGKVISCQTVMLDQRVITQQTYPYRIAIEFTFQSDKERAEVQRYYEEIRGLFMVEEPREVPGSTQKAA